MKITSKQLSIRCIEEPNNFSNGLQKCINNMTSEQPLKKKPRREDDADNSNSDETDFIHNRVENSVPADFQALQLTFSNVNEDDLTNNALNRHFHAETPQFRINSSSDSEKSDSEEASNSIGTKKTDICSNHEGSFDRRMDNISIQPAPDIINETFQGNNISNVGVRFSSNIGFPNRNGLLSSLNTQNKQATNHDRLTNTSSSQTSN